MGGNVVEPEEDDALAESASLGVAAVTWRSRKWGSTGYPRADYRTPRDRKPSICPRNAGERARIARWRSA
ncbi:hypothetical protein DBA20_25015 [Pandoraea capi]|nr:hypothetical protein [Pandoraea sp. LA3]MDN4586248.1 hypothetical protein [Pandoraea capi]